MICAVAVIAIGSVWLLYFPSEPHGSMFASGKSWNIRDDAIRRLITGSNKSEFFVIKQNDRHDLLICGNAQSNTVDRFIKELGVVKNELVDRNGYTVPKTWSQVTQDDKWQFHFEPGSIIVEDFGRGSPRYFIVMLYSKLTGNFVITITDASEIIIQRGNDGGL